MTDNNDYRLYLEQKFEGLTKDMNIQFTNVHDKLDAIEIQTTRTNGRVTELEDKVDTVERDLLTHPITCNQSKDIKQIRESVRELRDKSISIEAIGRLKNNNWVRSIQIIGTLVALGMLYLGYKNLTKRVVDMGIPVVTNPRGEIITLPDSSIIRWVPNGDMTYTITKNK